MASAFIKLLKATLTLAKIKLNKVGQGDKWYTSVPEKHVPSILSFSPQNHAKYQNLEKHSILYNYKGTLLV